ncbi:MAG TPA: SpoIIE family protein phosphatase [Mycobacteriales bacterium]|nr:SpoIIE family protein phosphatase [Mycobacteriales bacterium]
MQAPAELVGDGPDAVPRARALATTLLAGAPAALVADAKLVVTELVTNATLHGAPPIVVRVAPHPDGVRIEVQDGGHTLPVRTRHSVEAMTGRGLDLVAAIATSWGVEAGSGAGKVVWAELSRAESAETRSEPDVDVDTLLREWREAPPAERRYPVRLGAVPTDLLLDAKAHIDNVVRELTLVRNDQATTGVRLAPAMAELVSVVTEEFAEARAEIKRQALAAAQRGDLSTDLTLSLPLSAADAGERYLIALDEADRHARAARLLTLAPPRSHRAFRRWYVQSLVDQLRAAARGESVAQPKPFPQVLAAEVDELAGLSESHERLQILQRVTAQVSGATSIAELADVVVRNAGQHQGVETARVFVLTDQRTLRSVAWYGGDEWSDDPFAEFPVDADLPGAMVARTGQPLFLRSLDQIHDRFPALAGYYPTERSLHIAPLTAERQAVGVLSVTFLGGEIEDEAQLAFVHALASLLAQSLGRMQITERVEGERGRERQLLTAQLEVLTRIVAGVPLAVALEELLLAVEAVSAEGMLGSVLLFDPDGQRLLHCAAPSLPDFYNEAIDGIRIGPAVGSCGTAAHFREQVIVEDVLTDERWVDFRELAVSAGLRACWSTPIIGTAGELLGTFAMYYPQPQHPSRSDLALINVLVRTVTMVVERSRADEAREQALAEQRAAALTLQHSLVPEVPSAIGPVRLEARYRAGDPGVEVGGDWFDAVAVDGGVMLVVGDVQGHDLRAASVMGQLRTVARASAGENVSPAGVLAAMNRYLSRLDVELLTTAVVVRLDRHSREATIASAGHLPPMLMTRRAAGWRAEDVAVEPGPPLAVGEQWTDHPYPLPAGGTLLLYTDGLVESRAWPLDHGLELLRKTLESLPVDGDLTGVLDAALDLVPSGSRGDDVAVLAAALPD